MSSKTSHTDPLEAKGRAEEARFALQKEQEQLAAIRDQLAANKSEQKQSDVNTDKDFEGGYGGQEDLEDRYATTCGEH